MANIPQVLDSQKFSVGVGTFDSENAIAVGTSFRVSEHLVAKTSISSGSYGGETFGLGVSFGF